MSALSHTPSLTLTALPLRVTARVTNRVVMQEHKGSALRGVVFEALRRRSCVRLELATCHPCELIAVCPISALLATVDLDWNRGVDPPRPVAIDPPLDEREAWEAGHEFAFGLTVFGSAARLLPYLVIALDDAGRAGLGRRYQRDGFWTKGRFEVARVEACNPFSGEAQVLFAGEPHRPGQPLPPFRGPTRPVGAADVAAAVAGYRPGQPVSLEFLTPTRLVYHKHTVRFHLEAFVIRLLRRLEALERRYGAAGIEVALPDPLALARGVEVARNNTVWRDLRSYSARQKRGVPVGGFVGSVTLEGDLAPLLPYLAWGQLAHVGKDATKGNGWFRVWW